MEAAGSAPDVRSDRVAEVLQKMKDPSYINNSVVDLVADRLMDVYGL
jgi:negative regulator of flagellin synthesis FlgM